MPILEIISSQSCPYAQRTRMALLEKGIDAKLTVIDLDNKPGWFFKISPYAKVPVIRHGETVVFESAIINEYLEEVYPEHPLMPRDPATRAVARTWIDFANVRLVPHFYKCLLAQDSDGQMLHKRKILEALEFMEFEGLRKVSDGSFWLGKDLSLVDLTFCPHLSRFPALSEYRGLEIPNEYNHLKEWLGLMKERPSVKKTSLNAEDYIQNWRKYATNTSTGTTAQDMRES
jgi:glutathione S-transferase